MREKIGHISDAFSAWSMTRSLIGPLGSSSFKPELILNGIIGAPVKYRLRNLSITSKHEARCMG